MRYGSSRRRRCTRSRSSTALRAGKHVFCEKPLSLDLAECERVLAEAGAASASAGDHRFHAAFRSELSRRVRKIEAGAIGRPFMVRSQTCDKNDPEGFFVRFAPTSGGIFLDCSVHDIDVARWLLGNPRAKRVFASGTIALHEGLREFGDVDNGVAICEFEGGRLAMFYASRTMAHGNDTGSEVIGTAGSLAIGRNPRLNRVEIADAGGMRNECTPTFSSVSRRRFCMRRGLCGGGAGRGARPARRWLMRWKRRGSAARCGVARRAGNRLSCEAGGQRLGWMVPMVEYSVSGVAAVEFDPLTASGRRRHPKVIPDADPGSQGSRCARAELPIADTSREKGARRHGKRPDSQGACHRSGFATRFRSIRKQTGNEIVEVSTQDKTFVFLMRRR